MSGISPTSGSGSLNINSLYATLPNTTQNNPLLSATIANATQNTLLSNLDLTPTQQTQISQILKDARSEGLSPQQAQSQINAVLTPAQQAKLQSDLQARHHHHHPQSASAPNSSTDEFGIPTGASGSSASSSLGDIAAQYSIQSQLQDDNT